MSGGTFSLQPLSQFDGTKTNIRRPREVAFFSYDDHRKLLPLSEVSLKYYYPPIFGAPGESSGRNTISLSDGFNTFRKHDDSIDEHLDALLDTIQAYEEGKGSELTADFVTWRGMVTKIMTCLYDKFDGFEMNAVLHKGTIYIEEHKQGELRQRNNRQFSRPGMPSQEMMQYWGYKFEQLCTLNKPQHECTREEIESRSQGVVDNEAQYCSIVRTGIGDTTLLIGGEVDAVFGEKPDDPNDAIPWVELKTTKQITSQKDADKFEDKLLKYWAQSFLLGVPHVIVGFRTEQGDLAGIRQMATQKLASDQKRRAQENGRPTWDGNVCVSFTAAFLQFLKSQITLEAQVYRIQRRSKGDRIDVYPVSDIPPHNIVKESFIAHRIRETRAAEDEVGAVNEHSGK